MGMQMLSVQRAKGAFQLLADTGEQGEAWNVPKLVKFRTKEAFDKVFCQYWRQDKIWEAWWKRCSPDAVPHGVLFFSKILLNCLFSH